MRHLGNLTVTEENAAAFPAVTEIYGHLTIESGVALHAPDLTMVRGWVTVQPDARLDAPMLGLIDGWLNLDGAINALHLTEVRADLTMSEFASGGLPALRTIGGVNLLRRATQTFTSLVVVRDSLTIQADAELTAPQLDRIGKSLTLRANALLDAPALAHIGGYADIDETALIVAPKFTA